MQILSYYLENHEAMQVTAIKLGITQYLLPHPKSSLRKAGATMLVNPKLSNYLDTKSSLEHSFFPGNFFFKGNFPWSHRYTERNSTHKQGRKGPDPDKRSNRGIWWGYICTVVFLFFIPLPGRGRGTFRAWKAILGPYRLREQVYYRVLSQINGPIP